MTSVTLPLLLKLTSLRRLQAFVDLADPTPLVPILRQLRSLEVMRGSLDLDSFVAALQQCTELTDLHLMGDDLTSVRLASLLLPMRHLRRLAVQSRGLQSLSFLSRVAHLAQTLEELRLSECHLNPNEAISFLRGLRSLEAIVLDRCFSSESLLDPATVAALTPGADGFQQEAWPNLCQLSFSCF